MSKFIYTLSICVLITNISIGQIDIQPDAIAINDCNPLSELAINTTGDTRHAIHVVSTDDVQGSAAIHAKAFDVTSFGNTSYAIFGEAHFTDNASFSYGLLGTSVRTIASNNGRSFGVRGIAGNATPGANFGVFGDLTGVNEGAAILGYDRLAEPNWGQTIPPRSYAGYFRGKGYFHDNVGIGEEDPQSSLHVNGGDVYVEGSVNGVILESSVGVCWRITVDASGNLITTSVTCP